MDKWITISALVIVIVLGLGVFGACCRAWCSRREEREDRPRESGMIIKEDYGCVSCKGAKNKFPLESARH